MMGGLMFLGAMWLVGRLVFNEPLDTSPKHGWWSVDLEDDE